MFIILLWEYEGWYEKKFLERFLGLTALMFTLLFTTASAEVYEGTGYGYNQDGIVLDVEIKDNKIVDIQIKKEQESDFAKPAIKEIIKKAIATQSYEVDGISGASLTSEGTKEAIEEAVKASGAKLTKVEAALNKNSKLLRQADVVVIGGGAGLTSAIAAYEKGASVILIEKIELLGGKNRNNKALVKVLTGKSSAIVDWLLERGVDLNELTSTGGQSAKRTHRPTGGSAIGPNIITALSNVAEKDKIDIRKGIKAIALVKNNNKIAGENAATYSKSVK